MATLTVALDLDGTLVRYLPDQALDYTDPAQLEALGEPCPTLVPWARHLLRTGRRVAIVTGRTYGVHHQLTWRQLEVWGLDQAQLYMQPSWQGYEAMTAWKARVLALLGADVYVGDTRWDQDAAQLAGVPYLGDHRARREVEREALRREVAHATV